MPDPASALTHAGGPPGGTRAPVARDELRESHAHPVSLAVALEPDEVRPLPGAVRRRPRPAQRAVHVLVAAVVVVPPPGGTGCAERRTMFSSCPWSSCTLRHTPWQHWCASVSEPRIASKTNTGICLFVLTEKPVIFLIEKYFSLKMYNK